MGIKIVIDLIEQGPALRASPHPEGPAFGRCQEGQEPAGEGVAPHHPRRAHPTPLPGELSPHPMIIVTG